MTKTNIYSQIKQELQEIEFAMQNGFTDYKRVEEKDGSISFSGTFGYMSFNKEQSEVVQTLINCYIIGYKEMEILKKQKVENLEVTPAPAGEFDIEQDKNFKDLTGKELKVLKAIIKNSECEYGLPCDKKRVALSSGINGKSLSGVVSSLSQKGIVEQYDYSEFDGEFFLSEKLFNLYCI